MRKDERQARPTGEAAEIAEALKRITYGGVIEKNLLADMERCEALYVARI